MKKVALFIFLFIFAVNTVGIAAASAMPQKSMSAVEKTDMPCHGEGKAKKAEHCCKGICMCLQASLSPVLFYEGVKTAVLWPSRPTTWTVADDEADSLTFPPLRRPPKSFS